MIIEKYNVLDKDNLPVGIFKVETKYLYCNFLNDNYHDTVFTTEEEFKEYLKQYNYTLESK